MKMPIKKYLEPSSDEPVVVSHETKKDLSDSYAKLSGLATPEVNQPENKSRVISQQQNVEAVPEAPHRKIEALTEAVEAAGNSTKIVNQYGPTIAIITFFLVVYGYQQYRAETRIEQTRLDHIADVSEERKTNKENVSLICAKFDALHSEDRADKLNQWQALNRHTETFGRATASLEATSSEIKKLVDETRKGSEETRKMTVEIKNILNKK